MEDVLSLYQRKPNPECPRICFDERPCQLIGDIIAPLPMKPGQVLKEDNEYQRLGTCVVLLAYDIDTGQRFLQVRHRRTKQDYAEFLDWLKTEHYPKAKKILLVQDNLNTHNKGAFYQTFPPEKARILAETFEFHFTPKHGSWLNMAEIEFSALSRQCLDRRINSIELLTQQAIEWQNQRNQAKVTIHWSFTVSNARKKMAHTYHSVFNKN
jgi:hypothetical protein